MNSFHFLSYSPKSIYIKMYAFCIALKFYFNFIFIYIKMNITHNNYTYVVCFNFFIFNFICKYRIYTQNHLWLKYFFFFQIFGICLFQQYVISISINMQWSKENKHDRQINISENIVNRCFSANEKLNTISNKSLSDTFGYTVLFLNSLGAIKMEIGNHDIKRSYTENDMLYAYMKWIILDWKFDGFAMCNVSASNMCV